MTAKVPLAVVGVSWRTAPTNVRAQLAAIDDASDPVEELRRSGYVSGAVRVATCSRTEWVLAADEPDWAATLLRGALLNRVVGLDETQLHVRVGGASVHYLLRVAVGLDSVAEGEGAVGRQVLKAFEQGRAHGSTDRRIKQAWKHVERLIRLRREKVPGSQSRGVQALVREELSEREVGTVAIIGRGEFGLAMERSLRATNRWALSTWSRQSMAEFKVKAARFDAVVICTGANEAWLELPPHVGRGVCIDACSPAQLLRAGAGWSKVSLDQLLARPDMQMADVERHRLETLVMEATQQLTLALSGPSQAPVLAAIDAERTAFLNEQLPALLEGLPKAQVRRVRQAVGAFTHALLQKTREVAS